MKQAKSEHTQALIESIQQYQGVLSIPNIAKKIGCRRQVVYSTIQNYKLGSFKLPSLKARIMKQLKTGRTDYAVIAQELATSLPTIAKYRSELEREGVRKLLLQRAENATEIEKAKYQQWHSVFSEVME